MATVAEAARRWAASRIDVADATQTRHQLEVQRIVPLVGDRPVDALTPADITDFVAALVAAGYAPGTVRKTKQALAMILDHAGLAPNPARDKLVRLPRAEPEELNPPTADQVEALPAPPLEAPVGAPVPRLVGRPCRRDRPDTRLGLRRVS